MGKQAIDDDCNQTGQMLSALLNWPQATFASNIEVKDNSLEVTREIDEGLETVEINIPAIVTCDLRLNEPRYASLPNIMKAKKKPIEEAVKIKEAGKANEIVAITVGEEKAQETVRKALAVGADKGIHVKTEGVLEPLAVSKIIQKIVEKEKPDLVFMGKQAIDDDCNQTGQMLSALLNWPQATFASKIYVKENKLEVTREIDEGLETVEINIPAIVTCDLRLNEPRYASLPNIMKAKKKPIEEINVSDLGIDITPRVQQLKVEEPPKRKAGIKVANVAELVQKLKNEAKVI